MLIHVAQITWANIPSKYVKDQRERKVIKAKRSPPGSLHCWSEPKQPSRPQIRNLDTSWNFDLSGNKIQVFTVPPWLHVPKKKIPNPMSRWQGPCHQVLDQRLWVLWRLRAWPQASRAFDIFWPEWMLGFLQPFNQSYEIFLPTSARPLRRTCFRCAPFWLFWCSLRGREGGRHAREKVAKWMPGFKRIREKDRLNNTLQN